MTKSRDNAERRNAQRFPLQLPLAVRAEANQQRTQTQDISAGGVMFYLDSHLAVGTAVEFTVLMPAAVLGTPQDVRVNCVGRVVRCRQQGQRRAVAAIIDEYQFERP